MGKGKEPAAARFVFIHTLLSKKVLRLKERSLPVVVVGWAGLTHSVGWAVAPAGLVPV